METYLLLARAKRLHNKVTLRMYKTIDLYRNHEIDEPTYEKMMKRYVKYQRIYGEQIDTYRVQIQMIENPYRDELDRFLRE